MKTTVLSLLVSFSIVSAGFAETRKPNVVIFFTDDQPMDSFGFIRGKAHTPNIDRLAKEGAYFSNAYATSSVCSPSRSTWSRATTASTPLRIAASSRTGPPCIGRTAN